MKSAFFPVDDCLLVEPDSEETVRESGLVLTSPGAPRAPRWGTVASIGPGARLTMGPMAGQRLPMRFAQGQRVLYAYLAAHDVELDGVRYHVCREHDVFGVMSNGSH